MWKKGTVGETSLCGRTAKLQGRSSKKISHSKTSTAQYMSKSRNDCSLRGPWAKVDVYYRGQHSSSCLQVEVSVIRRSQQRDNQDIKNVRSSKID